MDWYFNVSTPADGAEHEEDGFATETLAMRAAEEWAMKAHGLSPGYRVRMAVSQDYDGAPRWEAAWPNASGAVRRAWACDQAVNDETMRRLTE